MSAGAADPDAARGRGDAPVPGLHRRGLLGLGALGLIGSTLGLSSPPARAALPGSVLRLQVDELTKGLERPWSLALLPDGRMLVSEKPGRLQLLSPDGRRRLGSVAGLPPVVDRGQGGLLDVVTDPDFEREPWIYWAYSEAADAGAAGLLAAFGGGAAGTAVARGRLIFTGSGPVLRDTQVILRQQPKRSGGNHFGARLVFGRDGSLFVTLGERQADDPRNPGRQFAQNPATTLGKVLRIRRDGSIPADNPVFAAGADGPAQPGLWSLGHRNPQGAALHPDTGELWVVEHGPQGGDELNRVRPGRNYGWPLRSYGCPYGSPVGEACRVGGGRHAPDFEEPVATWVPVSIAPADLQFCSSPRFPDWRGDALIPALAGTALWRVALEGPSDAPRERGRERLLAELGERLRCLRQTPDGSLLLLTDSGRLLRVRPG